MTNSSCEGNPDDWFGPLCATNSTTRPALHDGISATVIGLILTVAVYVIMLVICCVRAVRTKPDMPQPIAIEMQRPVDNKESDKETLLYAGN